MSKLQEYLEMAVESRDGVEANWINIEELKKMEGFNKILSLGFKLDSNDRQLKNGTLMFSSTNGRNPNKFSITSQGYVRRYSGNRNQFSNTEDHYQLNRNFMYKEPVKDMEHLEKLVDFLATYLAKNTRHI